MNSYLDTIGNYIKNDHDLIGDKHKSALFSINTRFFSYLLKNSPDEVISKRGVAIRKLIHPVFKKMVGLFLQNPQIIEPLDNLMGERTERCSSYLPKEPVIYVSNHGFHDDVASTLNAVERHAYVIFASLPDFYNTFNGIALWANGAILLNRKMKESRQAVISKAKKAMELGTDIIIFPEGTWNKTANKLILPLFKGLYQLSSQTGAKVVPVIHYISDITQRDKSAAIHTVIDNPMDICHMTENEALSAVRDRMATLYWYMMELYGKTTHNEFIGGEENSSDVITHTLHSLIDDVSFYDSEIELVADYRSRKIITANQVWQPIAALKNVDVRNVRQTIYAKNLLSYSEREDFQRLY